MRKRLFIIIAILCVPVSLVLAMLVATVAKGQVRPATDAVAVKKVAQDISASGSIHSENEATLHFQTGGKLVYLPLKKGDSVSVGQTIAQLDTYGLQKQLTQALNNYRSTRDTFDQTKDNSQNTVLFGQQRYNVEVLNRSAITTGDVENTMINDMIKRIVDQNQANLDNSVINVELAQYAIDLSSITAPFSGVITGEDVTTPNVNVTPSTSFSLADPNTKVFRVDVDASDIDFVSVGAHATVTLDGNNSSFAGTVEKIYPQKIVLPSGQNVYEVDIQADTLNTKSVFGQNGSVQIASNEQTSALMVPSWTVVGHNSIWVWENGKAVLKSIQIGKAHDDLLEITGGLAPVDTVIIEPRSVAKLRYSIL